MRVLAVLAFMAGVAAPLFASNHYIAPTGSDQAAGTVAAPWKTLEYAYGRMAAGDTVFVRAGTYAGVALTWNKSGAAGRPLVFDGLEITGYTRCAFNPKGGGKVTIRNCRMRRIQAQDYGAVTPQYCDSIVIEDNIFQESGRSLEQIQFDHAIYNAAGSHDIVIRNNLFLDNFGGPAINHYHTPSPYNVRIYNNVFVMTAGAERSGIFVGDPLFLDLAGRDLRLGPSSPAIEAGLLLDWLDADKDGNPRPLGAGPDIGAYEHRQGVSIAIRPSNPVARLRGRTFRAAGAAGMVYLLQDPKVPNGLPSPEDVPVFDIGGRRR